MHGAWAAYGRPMRHTCAKHYRAMLLYAQRGIATASRPSVCLSVTLRYIGQIGWNSSKIISRQVGLFALRTPEHHGCTPRRTPRNFDRNRGGVRKKWHSAYECFNISETRQDSTKVTIEGQQEVLYALSIGAKLTTLDDLEGSLSALFQNTCAMLLLFICFQFHIQSAFSR